MADNNHLKSKIFYISLHQKYTFGLVVHKTKSNQKWPKVKYSGSKPFLDMADNNHIKLNIFYISLNQKYTFGLVVHKTKSNQEWPKVNYSGLRPFIDMDDNNHKKLNIFYISLHRKYTFGLVLHKTKSNKKWPKLKSARKRQYVKKKGTLSVSANIPPPSLFFSVKQFYMIIISHIKKWFWTWIFRFWSLLVTFRLVDDKTKSILLVEVYVDSVIYQKTKSSQKWPKVTIIDQK